MMDDLLNLDFNLLDEDLLSFPMNDEFNPIESREIESILNEIEHSTNDKLFNVNDAYTFTKGQMPMLMFNNRKNIKVNKKSKNKIGTSLLAKPPKKLKKDKNSLLRNSMANSLLVGNRSANNVTICQATFLAYFYQDHNYCLNTTKLQLEQPINETSLFLDMNNNDSKLDNFVIEKTKEMAIDSSNQVLRKKTNSFSNSTLNLISPNLFNSNCELIHDLDDYFNISYSNSEETDCTSSNQSEAEDEISLKYELKNKHNEFSNKEDEHRQVENSESSMDKLTQQTSVKTILKDEESKSTDKSSIKTEIGGNKYLLLDDLNNYNINDLNTDTENELNSIDDEEEDILTETDILIDEMYSKFDDFEEFDLISNKKSSKASKNLSNKKLNIRNLNSKSPKVIANMNRRSRTISNSYSVRSSSSCSCCSDDMSEEEQPKRNETVANKQQKKSKLIHRKSTSKLIKADNTFIKKHKNNSRFMIHKNTSF